MANMNLLHIAPEKILWYLTGLSDNELLELRLQMDPDDKLRDLVKRVQYSRMYSGGPYD